MRVLSVWLRQIYWNVILDPLDETKNGPHVAGLKVSGKRQYLVLMIVLFNGEVISYELGPSMFLRMVTNIPDKQFLKLDAG
jgi:hypothetical protein